MSNKPGSLFGLLQVVEVVENGKHSNSGFGLHLRPSRELDPSCSSKHHAVPKKKQNGRRFNLHYLCKHFGIALDCTLRTSVSQPQQEDTKQCTNTTEQSPVNEITVTQTKFSTQAVLCCSRLIQVWRILTLVL